MTNVARGGKLYVDLNECYHGKKKLNIYFSYRYFVLTWCVANLVLLLGILRYDGLVILF